MDVLDTLEVSCTTPTGETSVKKIQLCSGDLSAIPPSWNTDLLLISAFRNDYTPTASSVVGALFQKGIAVKTLAKHKEEDLRSNYFCWYSKPLLEVLGAPSNATSYPFTRLMCFENNNVRSSVATDVGMLFRGLSTVSNLGSNLRVVSSLLKTGDSGYNRVLMLKAMVQSCVHWMLIGMPIECFSIVLYSRGSVDAAKKQYATLISAFGDLKKSVGDLEKKHGEKKEGYNYDFYLSCSSKDDKCSQTFSKIMKVDAPSAKFYEKHEPLSNESSWQSEMYENVKSSRKVVHFLSKAYLEATECVEQFNMAYCLNNSVKSLMAPLLLDQSTELPNYMKSIQWINCHKYDEKKMAEAAKMIFQAFAAESKLPPSVKQIKTDIKSSKTGEVKRDNKHYDVFISYAHKNKDLMTQLKDGLCSELSVFLDTEELHTGFQWQQAIYDSVEASQLIFAIFSEDYFNSAVCREELHLAMATVLSSETPKYLIPIVLDDSLEVPTAYISIKTFSLGNSVSKSVADYCNEAQSIVKDKKSVQDSKFRGCVSSKGLKGFQVLMDISRNVFVDNLLKTKDTLQSALRAKIVPVYSSLCILSSAKNKNFANKAKLLVKIICKSEVKVHCQQDSPDYEFTRLIDSSDSMLIFLDDEFLHDAQSISFLNICLLDCRLSPDKKKCLVVLTQNEFNTHTIYPLLISNKFCTMDQQWAKNELKSDVDPSGLSKNEMNCLTAAVWHLLSNNENALLLPDGRTPVLQRPPIS